MATQFRTSTGITLHINSKRLGRGGEGDVYSISSPTSSGDCVKIYFPKHRGLEKRQKVEYMIKNPPIVNSQSSRFIICWPKDLVFDGSEFIGFIMPLAYKDFIELYQFINPKMDKRLGTKWISKFDRSSIGGIEARLKVCTNLSIAIHSIHVLNRYVLVDMKPQNILVDNSGHISIIDCDSIQIYQGQNILFPARVASPEYSPAEGKRLNLSRDYVKQSNSFSLAVIFYELIFGIHPFAASFDGKYQEHNSMEEKITEGLFVHGRKKIYIRELPRPHENYQKIPKDLRDLFDRALDKGHTMPDVRPRADEWGETIFQLLKKK